MNIEELRALKEKIENNNQKEYVSIFELSDDEFLNEKKAEKLEEFKSQENTLEVVLKIERLLENVTNNLALKGIPFDQLVISSSIGFIIELDYIEKMRQCIDNEEEYLKNYNTFSTKIYPNLTPVSFYINPSSTGLDYCDIYEYCELNGISEEIYSGNVTGLVDWHLFVEKLQELGYDIEFLNYAGGTSYNDLVRATVNNGCDTQINVIADFGRKMSSGSR